MADPGLPRCVILGGGGHASVLLDALLLAGTATPVAVLDTNPERHGRTVLGVPVIGDDRRLAALAADGVTHFVVGVGGVRDNQPRRRLFERACASGLRPLTVVHPRAVVSAWAEVGGGSALMPGAIVNAGARLGVNVIVNSGAVVEHDCRVGNHVHVATGARLCSTVQVGDGAHVGAGAVVRQLLTIGRAAVVGAGAVVVEDVADEAVVVGVPARSVTARSPA